VDKLLAGIYLHQFAPAPAHVREALATRDGHLVPEDIVTFEAACRGELALLRAAAASNRILLRPRRNRLTGAVGLVLCEAFSAEDSEVVRVVAELLGPPGADWSVQTTYCDRLVWLAHRGELSIVGHGEGGARVAFLARLTETEHHIAVGYVARLLLSDAELAQWGEAVVR
jgi:hypothetical protein